MGGVGGIGGNSTIVVGTTPSRLEPGSGAPADDLFGAIAGDGEVLDAHSHKAGDFTESRKLPGGQEVFLTPEGARALDRLAGVRGPYNPMLFKDGDKGLDKAIQDWVTPGDRQKPIGVGNPG
ncbi:MAG: hypothetical protein VKP72_14670 [bacterium]|nr:hypothetical protein [bacterium]